MSRVWVEYEPETFGGVKSICVWRLPPLALTVPLIGLVDQPAAGVIWGPYVTEALPLLEMFV
jgi:hypothetical protein